MPGSAWPDGEELLALYIPQPAFLQDLADSADLVGRRPGVDQATLCVAIVGDVFADVRRACYSAVRGVPGTAWPDGEELLA